MNFPFSVFTPVSTDVAVAGASGAAVELPAFLSATNKTVRFVVPSGNGGVHIKFTDDNTATASATDMLIQSGVTEVFGVFANHTHVCIYSADETNVDVNITSGHGF
jgi:hypothetical protein